MGEKVNGWTVGVTGVIVTKGVRRALRGAGAGRGGVTESCTSVVTASKRDKQDNIRELLLCAPVRARRELPSAAWATRWFGSCPGESDRLPGPRPSPRVGRFVRARARDLPAARACEGHRRLANPASAERWSSGSAPGRQSKRR